MPAQPDIDALSPELIEIFRKYKSFGAAAKAGDIEAVKALFEHRKNSNNPISSEEMTQVLVLLAGEVKLPMAKVLVELGATTQLENGSDVAFNALQKGNPALVFQLLDTGVIGPNHRDKDSGTLLMVALHQRMFETADALFERGALLDEKMWTMAGGHTALHIVASDANFQGVLWLIEKGASPCVENTMQKIGCEMIPNLDKQSEEWDVKAMFDALEDYREKFEEGQPEEFVIPDRLRQMAHMEHAPMTAQEAQMDMFKKMVKKKGEEETSVIPKQKKKMGF